MKKYFLLIEEKSYRAEVNMCTAEAWEKLSGKKIGQFEMEAARSLKTGGVPTRDMVYWLFCSLQQGEELEGRQFPYTLDEMRKVIRPSILTQFAPIFIACYVGNDSKADKKKVENSQPKKRIPWGSIFSHLWFWGAFAGLLTFIFWLVLRTFLQH